MASAPISTSQTALSPASGAPLALQNRLNSLTRRRNSVVMGRNVLRALIPGVWVSAIGITLYKTHIIADAPIWLPLVALGACALWGLRNGLSARGGTFRAALDADATLGLKDSLGSALSFVTPDAVGSNRAAPAPKTLVGKAKRAVLGKGETFHISPQALETSLVPALVEDASRRAQSLDPRSVYSWKFDHTAKVFAVGVVLLIGSLFVPDNPLFASKKELTERTAIMKSGERLAMLSKEVRKRENPNDAQVSQLNKRLEKLGLKMARGRMTKRAALTQIGELKQQLQKAQQQQPPRNQQPPQQNGLPQIREAIKQAPMQSQAGQKVQQDLMNNKFNEAARRLEELADKLDKGQLSKAEKEQAAKDLEEVAKQLRERGGEANQQAAKQLEEAAKQLRQPEQQQGQQSQQGQNQQQGNQEQSGDKKQGGQQQQGGQQKQGQEQQQGQQGQKGQQGGQQQGQQGQQPQNQQGQQGQQGQKGQEQQQGQQGQQGQKGQQGQQQQSGQQGQQQQGQKGQGESQSQNGQQQNKQQGQQGSQGGQQGQSPDGKQGEQGGQSGNGGEQNGQGEQGQGQSNNASGALRDMANSLRQGTGSGGGSSNLRDMMNNLRQAENGANGGSASGKGSVNPKMGQGECPGGDCRGLATPGKDLMSSDPRGLVGGGAGLGPRSHAQGVKSGGGVSKQKSTRTGDMRRYEDVWSDRMPKPHSKIDRVKGKWGGSGEVEQLPTRGDGKGGQAHTPYYDVYESYKRDAEDAVGRESVPPAYKAPVKDYFESIKP
ncbi:hypothetical protein EON83_13215 [bacterium]|nr:MAG: hypothetical protein EON83_13215 [bacterium]